MSIRLTFHTIPVAATQFLKMLYTFSDAATMVSPTRTGDLTAKSVRSLAKRPQDAGNDNHSTLQIPISPQSAHVPAC